MNIHDTISTLTYVVSFMHHKASYPHAKVVDSKKPVLTFPERLVFYLVSSSLLLCILVWLCIMEVSILLYLDGDVLVLFFCFSPFSFSHSFCVQVLLHSVFYYKSMKCNVTIKAGSHSNQLTRLSFYRSQSDDPNDVIYDDFCEHALKRNFEGVFKTSSELVAFVCVLP